MDILLGNDGDLYFSNGDMILNHSVSQKIKIHLKWFLSEWRWDREMGLPYFEELLVKNANKEYFEELVRNEIFNIDEVTEVDTVNIAVDKQTRKSILFFIARTDLETIKGEIEIHG